MTALKRCSTTVSSRSTLPTSSPRPGWAKQRKDGRSCQPSPGTLEPISRCKAVKHLPGQHSQVGCRAASNLPATRLHVASGCTVLLRFRRCADQRQQQGTYGYVLRHEPPARQWHARGQGFKSPQLHHHIAAGHSPELHSAAFLAATRLSDSCHPRATRCWRRALSQGRRGRDQLIEGGGDGGVPAGQGVL